MPRLRSATTKKGSAAMTEQKQPVKCGECGADMILRKAKETYHDGSPRYFYSCSLFPQCRGAASADKWGKLIGIPADAKTKAVRSQAYREFEQFWRARGWSRTKGYRWLAERLRLTKKQCSFAAFDIERCNQVVDIIKSAQERQKAATA